MPNILIGWNLLLQAAWSVFFVNISAGLSHHQNVPACIERIDTSWRSMPCLSVVWKLIVVSTKIYRQRMHIQPWTDRKASFTKAKCWHRSPSITPLMKTMWFPQKECFAVAKEIFFSCCGYQTWQHCFSRAVTLPTDILGWCYITQGFLLLDSVPPLSSAIWSTTTFYLRPHDPSDNLGGAQEGIALG